MLNPVVLSHYFLFHVSTIYSLSDPVLKVIITCCHTKRKSKLILMAVTVVCLFVFQWQSTCTPIIWFPVQKKKKKRYYYVCFLLSSHFPVNVFTALHFLIFLVSRLTLQHHSIVCYLLSHLLRSKVTCIY